MQIKMVLTVNTRRWNTEKDFELYLQKEYESDFVPRVGDKIADGITSSGFLTVKEVEIYPQLNEVVLNVSSIYTQVATLEDLIIETNKLAVNGWEKTE